MSTEFANGGGDMAVTVTPATAGEAVSLLEGGSMDIDVAGFQLFIQQGDCVGLSYGVCFGNELEGDDTVVEQHGLRVFVDPASMNYIGGSTLDLEGDLQGTDFHVNNPNAESSCGCGESFRTQGPAS